VSTPINLNKARKARARAEKTARADANVVTFGLPKSEKERIRQQSARKVRILDGKALETPADRAKNGKEKP
jgi:hypothetical protein